MTRRSVIPITGASSGFGKIAATALIKQGHIDVLINNAGMEISGALELATEEEMHLLEQKSDRQNSFFLRKSKSSYQTDFYNLFFRRSTKVLTS